MHLLQSALWIGGMGAVGSLARALLGLLIGRVVGTSSWIPTLVINLLGSFGMGVAVAMMGSISDPVARSPRGMGITAGFLGGFTTYSAFAYQTFALAERRAYGSAALYVTLTVVGCFFACAAGVAVGRTAGR